MPYDLPPLPYGYDALEPVIGRETMELHHSKHHRAYVDALNRALEPYPAWQGLTIEQLLSRIEEVPVEIRAAVRNQGGGHANHQLFWKVVRPGGDAAPSLRVVFAPSVAALPGFSSAASIDDAGGAGTRFFARGGRRPCFTSSSSCDLRRRMW